jgi:hypothetical protein
VSQPIETDVALLPFTGNDEDAQPYAEGVRVFVGLNKLPSKEWTECFTEAVKATISSASPQMKLARPKIEMSGRRIGIYFVTTDVEALEVHAAVKAVVEQSANSLAKSKNERQAQLAEHSRATQQAALGAAASVRDKLRGR